RARLLSAHVVQVNAERLTAPHIVLAVGGYPRVPEIPGAHLGVTSNGFFELKAQPKRVAVVGTGYIGVELSGIFRALGSEVCLFSRYDEVLPRFEPLLQEELKEHIFAQGIDFQP